MSEYSHFKNRDKKKKRGFQRKKRCPVCTDKMVIDFKSPEQLRKFVSERGRIIPRRISGACAKHQRKIAKEIKKARIMGLLPFTTIDMIK